MKLLKFKVEKFRSVQSSGWIDIDQVNALIGENESGKTNLLLPLWKLNPSSNGKINLLSDAPRGEYAAIRDLPDDEKPWFVTAIFCLSDSERREISEIAGCDENWVSEAKISRRYDGQYRVSFPQANPPRQCQKTVILPIFDGFVEKLGGLQTNKTDQKPSLDLIDLANSLTASMDDESNLSTRRLERIIQSFEAFDLNKLSKTGGVVEIYKNYLEELKGALATISADSPNNNQDARNAAIKLMPTFIYYSNYGNLDGQIYLPRVIEDLEREDLTEKEAAKVRTLKVLFEYVKLDPSEILELGQDLPSQNAASDAVENKAEQKRERTVLLDSAGDAFTRSFSEWWKQGNYLFQFRADGDHFKVWVADKVRTEKIELENRSTGLQWFFSFFLVFLNERHDTHEGSVLLLDEPGVTLHPMAQKDLFAFFEGLANDNQLIYTTHSPFLMDPDKLDQVKAVYVDKNGHSAVSSDLRARANSGTDSEQKAIFPVHSALGITVSEVLFVGCTLILVEGPSDQYYLNAIKNILIGRGLITPSTEILFVPAGGTRGIKSTSRILSYGEDSYPFVLLDGDPSGIQTKKHLSEQTYEGRPELIYSLDNCLEISDPETEDLMDTELVAKIISKEFRGRDDFEDIYKNDKSIIPQVKAYCTSEDIELHKGWKVDIAREVKRRMSQGQYITKVGDAHLKIWKNLFNQWVVQKD